MSKYPFGLIAPMIKFPWEAQHPDPTNPGHTIPGTGCDVARKVIRLEDLVPEFYDPLSGDVELGRVVAWRQAPWECPGYGDIMLAIDHSRRYLDEAAFTGGIEHNNPRLLTNIGGLEFAPGRMRRSVEIGPWLYRVGQDVIITAPELGGTVPDVEIAVLLSFDLMLTAPLPRSPGIVYAMPTSLQNSGSGYCFRTIIDLDQDADEVQLHITAGDGGCNLTRCSVGIQAGSGPNMTATPVPALWSGQPSPALAATQKSWSDWVRLPSRAPKGARIVLNFSLFNNTWPYRNNGISTSYYSNTDCHERYDMPAYQVQPGRVHCVDAVRVRTI